NAVVQKVQRGEAPVAPGERVEESDAGTRDARAASPEGDLYPMAIGDRWTYRRETQDHSRGIREITRTRWEAKRSTRILLEGQAVDAVELESAVLSTRPGRSPPAPGSKYYAVVRDDEVLLYSAFPGLPRDKARNEYALTMRYPRHRPQEATYRLSPDRPPYQVGDGTAVLRSGLGPGANLPAPDPGNPPVAFSRNECNSHGQCDVDLCVLQPGVGLIYHFARGPGELRAVEAGPVVLERFERAPH
ncbi:MAG: hypothetical protein ACXWLR_10435, partial [Myxococcales bacterium]